MTIKQTAFDIFTFFILENRSHYKNKLPDNLTSFQTSQTETTLVSHCPTGWPYTEHYPKSKAHVYVVTFKTT